MKWKLTATIQLSVLTKRNWWGKHSGVFMPL